MSETIMSVQELIDTAFPDEVANSTINLRLLKSIVTIYANQLRVLNRRVQVSLDSISSSMRSQTYSRPNQVVSEIKMEVESKDKLENKPIQKHQRNGNVNETKEKVEKRKQKQITKNRKGKNEIDDRQIQRDGTEVGTNKDPAGWDGPGPIVQEGASIHDTKVDDLEELREREIRTISQRADSHEDPALSPSPMASVHSLVKENLLVVSSHGRTPKINVVTKDQFDELAAVVHELQARFDPIGIPNFPENVELLKSLRAGASLTEAMAAFQMSARLETFEKAFEIMLSLLTQLARSTPGINVARFQDLETNFPRGDLSNLTQTNEPVRQGYVNDWVCREEFNKGIHDLREEVVEIFKKSSKIAGPENKNNEMLLNQLERKIDNLNYGERIENLEAELREYAEKFIHLDISLSSQIGSYQEQLTQMQYQLDTGIENMVDKVAQIRTAPEVITELNMRLDTLQQDLENTIHDQNELKVFQTNMTFDLARLWKEIELIRDAKADREEMFDALRDKAGVEHLNGMVSTTQFNAVCVELEAKINASYNKFNNQELVWQMALDDHVKLIKEKGDWIWICNLRDDINRHLNDLNDKVNNLMEVVGEPRAAAVRKKLFRETDCVCCGTPASMNMELPVQRPPEYRRASADGADAHDMPSGDGDHSGPCIPNRSVANRDSRTHICQRFCGGSHTLIPRIPRPTKAPPGVTITHMTRDITTTVGSDGKAYITDDQKEIKPCKQCNMPRAAPTLENTDTFADSDKERKTSSFDIMGEMSWMAERKTRGASDYDYPPLPSYDD